ncbi:hypothetical protein BBO99_00002771 [Phytophthora kernoviae]|uniref:Transmembrane protein 242 n=2 Tax=Phytophthora kernoviae TaxID=325452 RepID=A0A421ETU7_9STRA|nr:hypothetical protein G195_003681 [Phytophthora kernoviae 00238/432]KAG2528328.1 hypothetical protein JM16_001309 [Phytophthora kernoviae]KAG2529514.1 hypothetical protein JM18_002748 [Phytophthora kernoviae]RLN02051.1 hypothetical protein BBI17_003545 [Phytophthora kernoviae]RLN82638.1 hypothetical protein BBO99_00002771 [Phytophthora kernoviae]
MNGVDDETKEPSWLERAASWSLSALPFGAVALLGGGFYLGLVRQKQVMKEEKLPSKGSAANKEVAARPPTFLERKLALDKPQKPNAAIGKALVGGTIVAVSVCILLTAGVAAALGVTSLGELEERKEKAMARRRKKGMSALNTQAQIKSEEEEMKELQALFSRSVQKPADSESESK